MASSFRSHDDPDLALHGDSASTGDLESALDSRLMNPAASAPSVSEAAERFAVDLRRTTDRLRSIGAARLSASFSPEPTRADAAFALIHVLAERAAQLAGSEQRTVPRLTEMALGDQLAVIGRELLIAARDRGDADVLVQSADELLDLRRRI